MRPERQWGWSGRAVRSSRWIGKLCRGLVWLLLLTALAILLVAWVAAGRLLHPERRPLQEYQRQWLAHPEQLGLQVHTGQCVQGRVPCLFVAPDARSGAAGRGNQLRRELASQGAELMPYGQARGLLVLLHGRGGRKEDLLPVAERFAAAGFRSVIPDLPAHGDSPLNTVHFATTAFERDIAADVLADARRYFGDRNSPAGIWGVSMGGAYALRAVARPHAPWRAVVIVASFDRLDGVVADYLAKVPRPLAVALERSLDLMLQLRGGMRLREVQPQTWASETTAPVMVAHGDRDQLIAPDRGRRLFNAARNPHKAWVNVAGATHRNVLVTSARLYARMSDWYIANLR